jgi:hypothetical protein
MSSCEDNMTVWSPDKCFDFPEPECIRDIFEKGLGVTMYFSDDGLYPCSTRSNVDIDWKVI